MSNLGRDGCGLLLGFLNGILCYSAAKTDAGLDTFFVASCARASIAVAIFEELLATW